MVHCWYVPCVIFGVLVFYLGFIPLSHLFISLRYNFRWLEVSSHLSLPNIHAFHQIILMFVLLCSQHSVACVVISFSLYYWLLELTHCNIRNIMLLFIYLIFMSFVGSWCLLNILWFRTHTTFCTSFSNLSPNTSHPHWASNLCDCHKLISWRASAVRNLLFSLLCTDLYFAFSLIIYPIYSVYVLICSCTGCSRSGDLVFVLLSRSCSLLGLFCILCTIFIFLYYVSILYFHSFFYNFFIVIFISFIKKILLANWGVVVSFIMVQFWVMTQTLLSFFVFVKHLEKHMI